MTVACTPSLFNICRKNAYQVRLLSYDLMDHLIVDYQERLDYHPSKLKSTAREQAVHPAITYLKFKCLYSKHVGTDM